MIDHTDLEREWLQLIVPKYNVPLSLREHQKDAMSLLKKGRHVFLGKNTNLSIKTTVAMIFIWLILTFCRRLPTSEVTFCYISKSLISTLPYLQIRYSLAS